jgi:hypothetical protein
VNALLNHDGTGQNPSVPERGACSILSQVGRIPAVMCGKASMTWQWGIQSDEARRKIMALVNEPEPELRSSEPQQVSEPAQFNAEIFDPPTNCRSDAGKEFSVMTVFPGGVVAVDATDFRQNGGNWYREIYRDCWIHESQLRWLDVPPISDGQVELNLRQSSIENGYSTGITTSNSSSRCNSPEALDRAGKKCGRRATTVRRRRKR